MQRPPAGPPRREKHPPTATTFLVLGTLLGGLFAGGAFAAFDTDSPPMPSLSAPEITYPTWPAVLTMRLEATATVEPTATPVQLPTATTAPVVYCADTLPAGTVCEWAPAPPPLPTAMPSCLTPISGSACRWQGAVPTNAPVPAMSAEGS